MNKMNKLFKVLVEEKNRLTEEDLSKKLKTTGGTVRSYISRLRDRGYVVAKRARIDVETEQMLPAEYFHVSFSEDLPRTTVVNRPRLGRTARYFADPV